MSLHPHPIHIPLPLQSNKTQWIQQRGLVLPRESKQRRRRSERKFTFLWEVAKKYLLYKLSYTMVQQPSATFNDYINLNWTFFLLLSIRLIDTIDSIIEHKTNDFHRLGVDNYHMQAQRFSAPSNHMWSELWNFVFNKTDWLFQLVLLWL